MDVTGTYDGVLSTSRFSAAVRLVARETASGSVTGTFILDSAANATAYTVTGQHEGQRLQLRMTGDTGWRIVYDATVAEGPAGAVQIVGTATNRELGLDSERLILTR